MESAADFGLVVVELRAIGATTRLVEVEVGLIDFGLEGFEELDQKNFGEFTPNSVEELG